jgi:hypothetical protein
MATEENTKTTEFPEWRRQRLAKFREQGINFRRATAEDAPALVSFHNSYHRTNKQPEYWVWEYCKYAPDQSLFFMVEKDGQILATDGEIPVFMDMGGKAVSAVKGENSLCLKQYRGTGLHPAIGDYQREQGLLSTHPISWSLSNIDALHGKHYFNTVYRNIQLWTRAGNLRLLIKARLRDNTPLWRRIGSAAHQAIKALFNKERTAIPQVAMRPGYEVKKEQLQSEALRELRNRLRTEKNKNTISIQYDDRYITWRIREHPVLKYDEYQVQQDDKLRAYAFVTMHDYEAFISELLSEDSHATSLLLSTIIKDYGNKTGQIRFFGNPKDSLSQDVFEQLPKFDFSLATTWRLTVWDRYGTMNTEFYQIENWNVSGLWTEGFQM